MEAGLDSLGAVELRNTLADRFAADLPATFIFDYPTAGALIQYLSNAASVTQVAPQKKPSCRTHIIHCTNMCCIIFEYQQILRSMFRSLTLKACLENALQEEITFGVFCLRFLCLWPSDLPFFFNAGLCCQETGSCSAAC